MIEVKISDKTLRKAAEEGADEFLDLIIQRTRKAIGGELNEENMKLMSSNQITLIGYYILREEVMNGGFIQLIYNGYGGFFFKNLFDLAIKNWGADGLCRLMRKAKKVYQKYRDQLEVELTDDEFMALYEVMPEFDDLDDEFITSEEEWTDIIAAYVDEHLTDFIVIS